MEDASLEVGGLGFIRLFGLALGFSLLGLGPLLFFGFSRGGGAFGRFGDCNLFGGDGLGVAELFASGEGGAFGGGARFIEVVLVIA